MKKKSEMHHALESLDSGAARQIEDSLWLVQGRKCIIRKHLQKVQTYLGQVNRIMDVGCGSGGNLDVLAEFGEVIGIEPSVVLAERSRSRGIAREVYELPAWQLDETHTVDLFTMFDVLEHIEDDAGFLAKLKLCAAQNHSILLSVPACEFLYGEHDKLLSHHRRYTKKMLSDCLVNAGYKPLSIRYYMFFPFPGALAMRIIDKAKSGLGFKRETVNLGTDPPILNSILSWVLRLESTVSDYVHFPIGLWLFVIAKPSRQ